MLNLRLSFHCQHARTTSYLELKNLTTAIFDTSSVLQGNPSTQSLYRSVYPNSIPDNMTSHKEHRLGTYRRR